MIWEWTPDYACREGGKLEEWLTLHPLDAAKLYRLHTPSPILHSSYYGSVGANIRAWFHKVSKVSWVNQTNAFICYVNFNVKGKNTHFSARFQLVADYDTRLIIEKGLWCGLNKQPFYFVSFCLSFAVLLSFFFFYVFTDADLFNNPASAMRNSCRLSLFSVLVRGLTLHRRVPSLNDIFICQQGRS
jgi:hypothetical protein